MLLQLGKVQQEVEFGHDERGATMLKEEQQEVISVEEQGGIVGEERLKRR